MADIFLKRIYEPYKEEDGYRILVDRLWPRGIAKAGAKLDLWLKDIAPSKELRQWFGHQPEKFPGFHKKYTEELHGEPKKRAAVEQVLQMSAKGRVTLLYAAKDPLYNHVQILYEELKNTGAV